MEGTPALVVERAVVLVELESQVEPQSEGPLWLARAQAPAVGLALVERAGVKKGQAVGQHSQQGHYQPALPGLSTADRSALQRSASCLPAAIALFVE